MIKLLAVDMDGTCLDGRSRMSAEKSGGTAPGG